MTMNMTSLSIDSSLNEVARVAGHFKRFCGPFLPADELSRMELCLVEAVTNVVEHAYGFKAGNTATVNFALGDDALVIEILDAGVSMQPGQLERETCNLEFDPDDLQALPEGGIGLEIMKHYLDGLEYRRVDGQNVLRMTRHMATGVSENVGT